MIGIDGAERLVHEQQRRIGRQGAGDADALTLAAGELRRVALAHPGLEADELEQLGHPRADAAGVPAQQAGHGADVLGHGEVREEPDLLDRVADGAPELRRRAVADAHAVDEDVAAGELDHAVDEAHGRRLAASRTGR